MNSTDISTYTETQIDIIKNLLKKNKSISSKYFYDEKGSQLFDQICELDEYYPTRTETKILNDNIDDIISIFDKTSSLIELGSGSSLKTRILLDRLTNIKAYIPIDISEEHLLKSASELKGIYANLNVVPIVADYTKRINFPDIYKNSDHKVAFFPGSTIGNFTPSAASNFLEVVADDVGDNGGLIIGIDLKKDSEILNAAYNDNKGVTAAFNLNILNNMNNTIGSDFDEDKFEHYAFYNTEKGRIEMHLKSKEEHKVRILDNELKFKKDELILTEYSYKYSIEEFKCIAEDYFNLTKIWTDDKEYFALLYFKRK